MNTEYVMQVCQAMQNAEREGAELMHSAHKIITETKSSARDVVTEYDRRVQELVMSRLKEVVPDACFFDEEESVHGNTDADHLFIIDPIDGTMNFVHHLNHSCISIAYAEHGEVCAAAVYNPYVDEMFTAVKGLGAYLNGEAIHVDDQNLANSLVCYGTAPYRHEFTDETFRIARLVFDNSLDIRRQGSAELDLCSVAAGRTGLYFEASVFLWDFAAGKLLVEEAGGVCRTLNGGELPTDGRTTGIAAGGSKAVTDFVNLVFGG